MAEHTGERLFLPSASKCLEKVQGVGLQARYSRDAELAIRIRLLPALAFAAPDEVPQLFALVAEQLPITEASDLILYFENTYIGRVLPGGGIQAPLFPISMWNYYLETPFGLPRTNNAVKAWHRSFNVSRLSSPKYMKFINALKREQALIEFKQAKFIAGSRPTKRPKHKYGTQGICLKFYYRPRMEFLRGVEHQFAIQTT